MIIRPNLQTIRTRLRIPPFPAWKPTLWSQNTTIPILCRPFLVPFCTAHCLAISARTIILGNARLSPHSIPNRRSRAVHNKSAAPDAPPAFPRIFRAPVLRFGPNRSRHSVNN